MKLVYQTDSNGVFLYETRASELTLTPGEFNIPFGAYEDAPPSAPPGLVAQRQATDWKLVEDHRNTKLWIASSGEPYQLGKEIEAADKRISYDGIGPIPNWLTVDGVDIDASQTDGDSPRSSGA